MTFFDTHAHLDDEQLRPELESFLQQAQQHDVIGINSIGTTATTSRNCAELAQRYENVYASVGIHPNYCHQIADTDWPQILQLANLPHVVAIGETGLDRYWDDCPFELQQNWFANHIELSFETEKPLVIHMRDCEADMLALLNQHQRAGRIIGIMHSFTGSWETAQQCLDWGMFIGFSGIVTFKNSGALREIAGKIPDDRLLIETDAPYLTPHPFRSKRPNHPALVVHTAQCLADIKNMSLSALGELTTQNARRVFRIESPF